MYTGAFRFCDLRKKTEMAAVEIGMGVFVCICETHDAQAWSDWSGMYVIHSCRHLRCVTWGPSRTPRVGRPLLSSPLLFFLLAFDARVSGWSGGSATPFSSCQARSTNEVLYKRRAATREGGVTSPTCAPSGAAPPGARAPRFLPRPGAPRRKKRKLRDGWGGGPCRCHPPPPP